MSKKVLIGGLAGVVVVGLAVGGWVYARKQATEVARYAVENALTYGRLQGKVTYQEVTASPFGSMAVRGIAVTTPEGQGVTIDEILIKDADLKDGMLKSATVVAQGIKIPLVELAGRQQLSPSDKKMVQQIANMGYGVLNGDVTFATRYDIDGQTSVSSLNVSIKDMMSVSLEMGYGNLSKDLIQSLLILGQTASAGKGHDQEMMGQLVSTLGKAGSLTLLNNSFRIDMRGLAPRLKQELDKEKAGQVEAAAAQAKASVSMNLNALGVAPAEADKAANAVSQLLLTGAPLSVKSGMSGPLALFKNGNFMTPTFTDVGTYLAVTKTTISSGT